jgi:hypothetical protein
MAESSYNLRFLERLSTLEACWSVLDREPGMDDLAEGAEEILKQMGEDLKIYPFQDTDGKDRLFLARFEFPKYDEDFTFPEAGQEGSFGFIDFLAGFPLDCVEILVAIGEFSSKAKQGEESKVSVDEGTKVFPTIPSGGLFKWPEKNKILLNLTAIPTKDIAKFLAKNLAGEPKPATPKWWYRVQLRDQVTVQDETLTNKFPVPGEFLGLGVRIWPGKYWGHQKSNPFVYTGNWMDTVYYSSARITEVIDPTDEIPYPTYKITWHGKDKDEKDKEITVNPSDFALYKVGDRVTVLKDVASDKKTQLWKDDDMKTFGETWMIAPIGFYGLDIQEEE